MDLSQIAKMAAIVTAISTVVTAACRGTEKVLSWWRNSKWGMKEIEQCDPWWTARERNPILSRRRR
jgi:hypothetical protein